MKDTLEFPYVIPLTWEICVDFHEKVGHEVTSEHADLLAASGHAVIDDSGVFAIGGLHEVRPGVGMAWAILDRHWRKHAKAVTEACMAGLDVAPYRRIESVVLCGFDAGGRWLERMGFEMESPRMRAWGVDGQDYALYARVK